MKNFWVRAADVQMSFPFAETSGEVSGSYIYRWEKPYQLLADCTSDGLAIVRGTGFVSFTELLGGVINFFLPDQVLLMVKEKCLSFSSKGEQIEYSSLDWISTHWDYVEYVLDFSKAGLSEKMQEEWESFGLEYAVECAQSALQRLGYDYDPESLKIKSGKPANILDREVRLLIFTADLLVHLEPEEEITFTSPVLIPWDCILEIDVYSPEVWKELQESAPQELTPHASKMLLSKLRYESGYEEGEGE